MRLALIRSPGIAAEQHAVIRAELGRLLRLSEFRGSKRCSDFLAYAVDQTLIGAHESELKERTIAVEVFGRTPSYDSNEDSIVRVTARDVRKRLAQCYLGMGADHPVRIELKTGSYGAEFHWPEPPQPESEEAALPVVAPSAAPARRWRTVTAWCIALPAFFFAGWMMKPGTPAAPDILRAFWGPLLQNPGAMLMCMGTPTVYDVSDRLRSEYLRTPPSDARMRPFVIPFSPRPEC